jgi:hypothetical protein
MMRFWQRFGARGLEDFADAIRPELKDMPAPRAGDALLDRIVASRASGARIILPHDDVQRASAPVRYALAIAVAAVLIVVGSSVLNRDSAGLEAMSAPSWFARSAFAQAPPVSIAPLRVTAPQRLKPLTIRYARTLSGRRIGDLDITVQRDSVDGVPAWRVVAVRGRTEDRGASVDTVHVATSDLALLRVVAREVPYASFASIRVAQRIDGLRISGSMEATRDDGESMHRTFDRKLSPQLAPYIVDAIAPIYMMGVGLRAGWRGRLATLGWAVRDNDIAMPIEMRVDGEETVRVPAGEFACWRIAIDIAGKRQWYWVRKSDGLGIRSRVGSDREIVLETESAGR